MAAVAAPTTVNNAIYRSGEMLLPKVIYDRLLIERAPIAESTGLLPPLAKIVMDYVLESAIFGWYTAFTKLYTKQEQEAIKLPALPLNILQTLQSPITAKEARAFGVAKETLVSEIYSLRLVHEGSLNDYEERLARYRREHLNDPDAKALQFRHVCNMAKDELGASRNEWGWALVSKSVLPNSQYKSYGTQIGSLPSNCQLPEFSIACTSTIDHALTTEKLLQEKKDICSSIYTRVLETHRFCVGGFSYRGLQIIYADHGGLPHAGVVAVRFWN